MSVFRFALLLLAAACVISGCGQGAKAPPTQKQEAHAHWNRTRAAVLLEVARKQYSAADYGACASSLDEALKHKPDLAPAYVLYARVNIEQGKLENAERHLQRTRELEPMNAEAAYLSGVIYQRWNKQQAALDFYTKAAELAPAELPYLLARAELLVTLDRRNEALQILQEKLSYFENSAPIRDAVGQLLVHSGQYTLAARVLRQAAILAPEEAGIREHLALALFYGREYREAALVLEKLIQEERYRTRADLLTALGEAQLHLNRPRDARDNFEVASQLNPGSVAVWINLAKAAMAINDPRRAEASLKKAMTLESPTAEMHLLMGYVRLKQKNFAEALSSFRQAALLDPQDTTSLCMIGLVLEKQGKPQDAMQFYARALRLKPTDDLASQLMAQIQTND